MADPRLQGLADYLRASASASYLHRANKDALRTWADAVDDAQVDHGEWSRRFIDLLNAFEKAGHEHSIAVYTECAGRSITRRAHAEALEALLAHARLRPTAGAGGTDGR